MHQKPVLEINIPNLPRFDRGKVRDVFEVGKDLLVVATDRIFAFDSIYPGGLFGKGRILTSGTCWAFNQVRGLIANYLISSRVEEFPPSLRPFSERLRGRSFLVQKVTPIRVECVVRGYLYGQAWRLYRQGKFFWDPGLPAGMKLAGELPRPLFTPARKVRDGEDENISLPDLRGLIGEERTETLQDLSLKLYARLRQEWARRGFILADTKFEFGLSGDKLLLINEASTPDSSRFWRMDHYRPGRIQESWDKDILENYLRRKGWSLGSPFIPISSYIRRKMRERFEELVSLI